MHYELYYTSFYRRRNYNKFETHFEFRRIAKYKIKIMLKHFSLVFGFHSFFCYLPEFQLFGAH